MTGRLRSATPLLALTLLIATVSGCAEVRVEALAALRAASEATTFPYDLPANATIALTSTQPGQPTGLKIGFAMTFGQLETFSAVITVPAAFTFRGFDALGPAGTAVGHYGFDFSPPPPGDGVPEVVLTLRALTTDTAYMDSNFNGTFQSAVEPIVTHSLDGSGNHVFTAVIPLGGDGLASTVTATFSSAILASLSTGILANPTTPGVYTLSATFTSVDPDTDGASNGGGKAVQQIPLSRDVTIGGGTLVAAMLPSSRSVPFGTPATAFASIINAGTGVASQCAIGPITAVPAFFSYQTTDPATNVLTGTANTPANILPGAVQTFVIALTPFDQGTGALEPTEVEFAFDCGNTVPAPSIPGLNSLLLSAQPSAPPDIIAVAATPTNDGIAVVPGVAGVGVFGVAGINIGSAATIVARPVAKPGVPVALTVCETTGSPGGACLQAAAATTSATFATNQVRTFTVFVSGTGSAIPADLASSRVSLRFEDGKGTVRGATNVAVQTGL